jgi:uncharacterized protein (TIRG00374 family)
VKDRLLNLLKVAVSLGLIAYIVTRPTIREADWGTILASVRIWPWLLGLALYFIAIGLQVLKWQILLQTLDVHVPYSRLFRHNLVGLFFANLPLAMLGGDIARGWDLARHTEGQTAPVAVSVLVDRLIGLAAFLLAAVLGLGYAVWGLDRPDTAWVLTTLAVVLAGFAVAFALLMSQRLRQLVERAFSWGPLTRFLPLYRRLSDSVQGYRKGAGRLVVALILGLLTVLTTVGADVSLVWVAVLTPLTAFAPFVPSIASGLGVNQGVFVALYHNLAGVLDPAPAFAMSLVMQVIIYAASLPGAVLWWQRRG